MRPKKTIITDYKGVEHTYDPTKTESPLLYEVRVELREINYRGNTESRVVLWNTSAVPKSAVQNCDLLLPPAAVKNLESTPEDRFISLLEELGVQFEQ